MCLTALHLLLRANSLHRLSQRQTLGYGCLHGHCHIHRGAAGVGIARRLHRIVCHKESLSLARMHVALQLRETRHIKPHALGLSQRSRRNARALQLAVAPQSRLMLHTVVEGRDVGIGMPGQCGHLGVLGLGGMRVGGGCLGMMRHRSLQGLERMGPGYAIGVQMMIGLKGAQGVLGLGSPKTIDSEGMVIAVVITERMQIALQMPELVMRHGAMGDMHIGRRRSICRRLRI